MEKIKSVGGYIRVSTTEQAMRGVSLESQEEAIRAWCSRNGYKLVDLYIDRGITARKKLQNRKEFCRMMQDVQNRRINHIVVLRLDRFFRNTYDYHRMMKEYLEPNGCEWSAINEDYDTATTNGRLMINLRLAIAEQECDIDSDRIKDVFRNRIRSGHVVTGRQAMGYSITEDKRLVPNEDAQTVRDIFDSFLSTGCVRKTMMDIREKDGLVLNFKSFRAILSKEIYIGKYRDNRSFCEPIIEKEKFEIAQKMLESNTWYRPNTQYKEPFFFSGLLICPDCGKIMSGCRNTWGYKSYRCMGHYGEKTCPNNRYLSEPIIERYLEENLIAEWDRYRTRTEEGQKRTKPKADVRQQIEGMMKRLNELYIKGTVDMKEYEQRYQELEERLTHAEKEATAEKRESRNDQLIRNFKEVYSNLTPEEKNPFWRYTIKEVHFESKSVSEIIFL